MRTSRLAWLFCALIVASVLAALQQWALHDFLYWRYAWFDVPMHYLGGLFSGLFVVAILKRRRKPKTFLFSMAAVFVGWEAFEFLIGSQREANFAFDTAVDLLMDALGALTAYALARYTLWRSA